MKSTCGFAIVLVVLPGKLTIFWLDTITMNRWSKADWHSASVTEALSSEADCVCSLKSETLDKQDHTDVLKGLTERHRSHIHMLETILNLFFWILQASYQQLYRNADLTPLLSDHLCSPYRSDETHLSCLSHFHSPVSSSFPLFLPMSEWWHLSAYIFQ